MRLVDTGLEGFLKIFKDGLNIVIFRHIFLGLFVFRMFIEENEEEIEKVKRGQLRLLSPFEMI